MNADEVIHMMVPVERLRDPAVGSQVLFCEKCKTPSWYDPKTCDEVNAENGTIGHRHLCDKCALRQYDELPDDEKPQFVLTKGTVLRGLMHGRRN